VPPPSVRKLARQLGLSHTTVSEALRDSPRVRPETRKRVLEAARMSGYQANPLAGALMSEMRRSRTGTFRGSLAIVDLEDADKRPPHATRYHNAMTAGAIARAADLGFKAERIYTGQRGISLHRLDTILQSRGIRGLFLLPTGEFPDIEDFPWSRYAGVYGDYIIDRPPLHSVCPGHFRAMVMLLQKLESLGYRRAGLVLEQSQDSRLFNQWEAAFTTYNQHNDHIENVPPMIATKVVRADFMDWFRRERPDVVISHHFVVTDWMAACGAKVPETHGYCCLNTKLNTVPCAGIDLQPELLGARGIELVVAQLLRNEYGAPKFASNTSVPARWIDGPTLRPTAIKRARTKGR